MRAIAVYLRRRGGFTVIEMLIALTLVVSALIPLAMLLSTSLKTTVNTSTRMHAREVAVSEIDKIKSFTFDAVGISSAIKTFSQAAANEQVKPVAGYAGFPAGPVTVEAAGGNSYTVTRDVRKYVNTTATVDAETKKVLITVSWTSPEPQGSIELTTIIGPTDMNPN